VVDDDGGMDGILMFDYTSSCVTVLPPHATIVVHHISRLAMLAFSGIVTADALHSTHGFPCKYYYYYYYYYSICLNIEKERRRKKVMIPHPYRISHDHQYI